MRKIHVTSEDGACPPGALGKCPLSMGQDLMLYVSFTGHREGREHQGLHLCSSGSMHTGG